MTQQELYTVLESTSYPVAYRSFVTSQQPPFIVYYFVASDDFYADGINYKRFSAWNIGLYTLHKNPSAEIAIETALSEAGIAWIKSEAWIESEDLLQVLYEIEIMEE